MLIQKMKNKVIIFADAFGYELLTESERDILRSAKIRLFEIKPPLAYTFGILASFFTGKPPRETNIWTENYLSIKNAKNSLFLKKILRYIPNWVIKNQKLNYFINILIDLFKKDIILGKIPVLNIPANIIPYFYQLNAKTLIFKRHVNAIETIFNKIYLLNKKVNYLGWPKSLENIDEILEHVEYSIVHGKSNIIFAYISDIDHFAHNFGVKSKEVLNLKRKLLNFIKDVLMQNLDLDFAIISDHSMENIKEPVNLTEIIEKNGYIRGNNYIDFIDSTIQRFWIKKSLQSKFSDFLINSCSDYGHILSLKEKKQFGIDFSTRKFGDIIFLANPGITFSNNFFSITGKQSKALHGYSPNFKSQHGLLISNMDLDMDDRILTSEDVFNKIQEFVTK